MIGHPDLEAGRRTKSVLLMAGTNSSLGWLRVEVLRLGSGGKTNQGQRQEQEAKESWKEGWWGTVYHVGGGMVVWGMSLPARAKVPPY